MPDEALVQGLFMGYLSPDFTHDVFISYSHGDSGGTGSTPLKAWSQEFAAKLQGELSVDPRFKDVAIFIDANKKVEHGLDPTLPLTQEVQKGVQSAALLTILMSPWYLQSGWCRDERGWWLEASKQNGGFWGRTFVARIMPINDADWPNELRDERGIPPLGFWYHSRPDGSRPFGWNGRTDDNNEYTKALLDFVTALSRRLLDMKAKIDERKRQQDEAQRLGQDQGQTLYLYARSAHRELWGQVHNELSNAGFFVTPAQPEPPIHTPDQMRQISEQRLIHLVECDALLLLGTEDGIALDGDMLSVGRQSRNVGRARSGKLLPCAVLDRSGGSAKTDQRVAAARKLNIHWIDGSGADWLQRVRVWLLEMGAKLDAAA
jgi:hypothetical protein